MAVTIQPEGRVGNINVSYQDGQRVVTETYSYLVITDDIIENRALLLYPQVAAMPRVNFTVSPSGLGICSAYDLKRDEKNAKLWHLDVNFTSNPQRQNQDQSSDDPEEWVPIYEVFNEPYSEEVTRDFDGRAITNAAGDPYDSPPQIERDVLRYDFYQYESASLGDLAIAGRHNKTNSDTFRGFEPDTCLLKIRRSAIGFYFGYRRRLVEYSLLYKPAKWHLQLPNVGQSFIDENGKRHPYRFKDNPNKIISGPLGSQNYTLAGNSTTAHNFTNGDGFYPTYGIENGDAPGEKFAKKPADDTGVTKQYYIEYRLYDRIRYADFLR